MEKVITYTLQKNNSSEQYYSDISVFTDEFLSEVGPLTCSIIDSFDSHIAKSGIKNPSTCNEYLFELLMLGTLWHVYSGDALGLPELPQQVLTYLSELRQQDSFLKPGVDIIRGILSTLFLSPDIDDNMFVLKPTINHFNKLLRWLSATGEFTQEVKHLSLWEDFLYTCTEQTASDILSVAITLAAWFEIRSEEALGTYTGNVDNFLNCIRPSHYWHEDVIFSGRRRIEYHLNMLGAEIMNRANRKAFMHSRHKAVLLPACMCIKSEELCKARACPSGLACTGCSRDCRVNQLTSLGKKNNFDVFIITHESSALQDGRYSVNNDESLGIVGIACVLNLVSGGWKAKSLGLPAQCVLLDFCGCKKHWHDEGIVTDINLDQLKRIFNITD